MLSCRVQHLQSFISSVLLLARVCRLLAYATVVVRIFVGFFTCACMQVPEVWGSMKKLTHLWLFANQLTGPALPASVATVSGAVSLQSLRLSRNKFTGQVQVLAVL